MTKEQALNILDEIISSFEEDTSPQQQNKSSTQVIDELIEGTLNNYLETSKFPTEEECRVLLMLNKLKQEL